MANKVTHIINCAGREVKNSWERIGISYLTFRWRRLEDKAFDSKGIVISQIRKFIQNAVNSAESVLIHSKDGTSRAPAAAAAFFMTEYGWGLRKTMQFFHIKRDGKGLVFIFGADRRGCNACARLSLSLSLSLEPSLTQPSSLSLSLSLSHYRLHVKLSPQIDLRPLPVLFRQLQKLDKMMQRELRLSMNLSHEAVQKQMQSWSRVDNVRSLMQVSHHGR